MKRYETPDCLIVEIGQPDVICTSGENETPKIDLTE